MRKIFAILIICSFSLPVLAIESVNERVNNGVTKEIVETINPEEIQNTEIPRINESLKPVPTAMPSRYKEPFSKKKLAKKFVVAMLCVAGTSVFLYGVLSIYNKLHDGFFESQNLTSQEGERPLDSPNDLTDAVKSFIDRTHWEN